MNNNLIDTEIDIITFNGKLSYNRSKIYHKDLRRYGLKRVYAQYGYWITNYDINSFKDLRKHIKYISDKIENYQCSYKSFLEL